jgi:hypothetical protein
MSSSYGNTSLQNSTAQHLLAAQRLALPAAGRAEITPFCRNQSQAKKKAKKRAESQTSGARIVRRILGTQTDLTEHKTELLLINFTQILFFSNDRNVTSKRDVFDSNSQSSADSTFPGNNTEP